MSPARAFAISWKGSASSHAAAAALLRASGDVSLVERGRPRWLLMRCPCGCADVVSLNVDSGAGPAWRLYRNGPQLSVFPSVWRESGCESHFIIWRGRIDWLGFDSDESVGDEFKGAVRRTLRADEFRSFAAIADELSEIPWDVLQACRELVRDGLAVEARGKTRGRFKLLA